MVSCTAAVLPTSVAGEDFQERRLCRINLKVQLPFLRDLLHEFVRLRKLRSRVEEDDGNIRLHRKCEVEHNERIFAAGECDIAVIVFQVRSDFLSVLTPDRAAPDESCSEQPYSGRPALRSSWVLS